MNRKRAFLALVTALMLALCAGCSAEKTPERISQVGFYLDTVITLSAYTEDVQALKDALEECGRYEQILSRTVEGSDVWRINHANGAPVEVSDDTAAILRCALDIARKTGGAFDVTIAPASTLWDFTSGEAVLPDADEIAKAAALVDWTRLTLDGNTVTLPEGMMIDLGGIAKGYIADQVKAYLEKRGISGAQGAYMLKARNTGGSTVTSGIYERGFDLDGVRYHHLLSAETGWPVQNSLASVTIFSESSMEGDALSTAAFVLGETDGVNLIESLDGIEAVFITRDRQVIQTSGAGDWLIP